MATSGDQASIIKANELDENLLNCEICTEIFKRAKILPCGHTFCQKCLEKWAETNRGKDLTCPNCRKPWQVPEGKIDKLAANYHVNSLVEFVLASQTVDVESGPKKCEFCEIIEASLACVECRQFACDMCAKVHQRTKTMASHRVVSLEEYKAYYEAQPAELKPTDCDQHPGTQLELYCQTCCIPICMKCTIIEHRVPDHEHVYLSEAAGAARKSIEETLIKATEKLKYFEEEKINIKGVQDKLSNSREKAILEVEKHTDIILKQIRENKKEIIAKIKDTYEIKVKVLDYQLDRIELATGQVKSSFEHSKNLVSLATDAGLMSVHKQTNVTLEGILIEEIQVEPQVNHHLQYSSDPVFENRKQGSVLDNKAVACKSMVKIKEQLKQGKIPVESLFIPPPTDASPLEEPFSGFGQPVAKSNTAEPKSSFEPPAIFGQPVAQSNTAESKSSFEPPALFGQPVAQSNTAVPLTFGFSFGLPVIKSNTDAVLITFDVHGNKCGQGGAEVTAMITEGGQNTPCKVTDNSDGTYDINAPNDPKPSCQLSVFLFGQHVKNVK